MQLRVEKLVQGGSGFARLDSNKSIFIDGALPGELVEVTVEEEKKGYVKARVATIIQASSDRVVPPCQYYGICGGCDLQHLATEKQAEAKVAMVVENLKRIGAIDPTSYVLEPSCSAYGWAYRSRARFHVELSSGAIGFLGKGSNTLVPIDSCPVLVDELNVELAQKKRILAAARSVMFSSRGRRGPYIEVNAFAGDSKVSLGDEVVRVSVDGHPFSISAQVFFQSNLQVLPDLVRFVSEHAYGNRVMDLYSGVGTFSSFLVQEGRSVVAVESQRECLSLAKSNVPTLTFFTDKVELWAKKQKVKVDTVVVDPPRTGLDGGIPSLIASWQAQRIIYVSCDSVSLARDLHRFTQQGYTVAKVKVFDLYPQTFHQEVVVILDREEHTL